MTEVAAPRVLRPTEARNPRTLEIDTGTTLEMLRLLNAEDALVAGAVERVLPALAAAVDLAVERIAAGGTIHYFGAGTSGRLAVLDAAELLPTFNAEPGLVVAHHAGGDEAIVHASEDVEDSEELGARDAAELGANDVVVGIAASGRTPYVAGAMREARRRGAATVLVSCNPGADLARLADVHVAPDTGPEAIAGSTRLKAGTATKLVLNDFSTALMVRLGRTYSNLMVSVVATNSKLRGRLITILSAATGEPEERSRAALSAAGGDLKTAIVMTLGSCSPARARAALEATRGAVRPALAALRPAPTPASRDASAAPARWVVGLDIGGSGSRVRLAPCLPRDERERIERTGPGAHVGVLGVDVAALAHGLAPALDDLARHGAPHGATAAAIGMTGLPGLASDAAPLHAALASSLGVRRTVVASDSVTAFVGALGLRPGAVVAAGTGVIALGTDLADRWRRVDGWAHLLGDDGGGAWIGMQGLRSAMRAYDGRRRGSAALLERAVSRFGDPEGLPRLVYTREDRAAVLASFAPDVVDAAREGDPVAAELVRRAATHLAEAAEAAVLPGEEPVVAFTGGLLRAGETLLVPTRDALARLVPDAVLVEPEGSPLDGALTLAHLAATDPDRVPNHPPYVWTIRETA